MIDSGLSGIRTRKTTNADQPVASAIGTSGTSARRALRSAASSTTATASRPASSVASRRHGDAIRSLASAASTGSPASRAVTPGGGSSSRCIVFSTSNWRSSGISLSPNASVAVRRSGVITLCEKYGGTASSSASTRAREESDAFVVKRSGSENAGQMSEPPQPRARVEAQPLEDPRLVARHPGDHRRVGHAAALDEHVDLAADAADPLQPAQVLQRRQLLRDELLHVGLHARPGLQPPAGDRDERGDAEHAARDGRRRRPARAGPTRARTARRRARARVPRTISPAPRHAAADAAGRARGAAAAPGRSRAGHACAATPSVSAHSSASAMPTTSSSPKPRTIGTGESASTRKPAAVAQAAITIVGAPSRATRPTASASGSSSCSCSRDCSWIA